MKVSRCRRATSDLVRLVHISARHCLVSDTGPVHERRGPLYEYELEGNVEAQRAEGSHKMRRHNAKGRTVKATVVATQDVSRFCVLATT